MIQELVRILLVEDSPLRIQERTVEIAERRRAEEELRASEERYHSLFNHMTEGFALHQIITDERGQPCDYRFWDVNPSFERLTGLKRADVLGKRVLDLMPKTESHWIETYGKVALPGDPARSTSAGFAARLRRADSPLQSAGIPRKTVR